MVYEAMAPDEVLVNNSGGGGGWGNPFERDEEAVLADVVNGYVSLDAARDDYGVVIDAATMTIDDAATAALRREPRKAAARCSHGSGPDQSAGASRPGSPASRSAPSSSPSASGRGR